MVAYQRVLSPECERGGSPLWKDELPTVEYGFVPIGVVDSAEEVGENIRWPYGKSFVDVLWY